MCVLSRVDGTEDLSGYMGVRYSGKAVCRSINFFFSGLV